LRSLFGQREADAQRPKAKDIKPATAEKTLLFAFGVCHNYIAGTEGKQKARAFWELLKLSFCKIEDEGPETSTFYAMLVNAPSSTGGAPRRTVSRRPSKAKSCPNIPRSLRSPGSS